MNVSGNGKGIRSNGGQDIAQQCLPVGRNGSLSILTEVAQCSGEFRSINWEGRKCSVLSGEVPRLGHVSDSW